MYLIYIHVYIFIFMSTSCPLPCACTHIANRHSVWLFIICAWPIASTIKVELTLLHGCIDEDTWDNLLNQLKVVKLQHQKFVDIDHNLPRSRHGIEVGIIFVHLTAHAEVVQWLTQQLLWEVGRVMDEAIYKKISVPFNPTTPPIPVAGAPPPQSVNSTLVLDPRCHRQRKQILSMYLPPPQYPATVSTLEHVVAKAKTTH